MSLLNLEHIGSIQKHYSTGELHFSPSDVGYAFYLDVVDCANLKELPVGACDHLFSLGSGTDSSIGRIYIGARKFINTKDISKIGDLAIMGMLGNCMMEDWAFPKCTYVGPYNLYTEYRTYFTSEAAEKGMDFGLGFTVPNEFEVDLTNVSYLIGGTFSQSSIYAPNIIVVDNGDTFFADMYSEGCKELYLGENCAYVDEYALSNFKGLKNITVPVSYNYNFLDNLPTSNMSDVDVTLVGHNCMLSLSMNGNYINNFNVKGSGIGIDYWYMPAQSGMKIQFTSACDFMTIKADFSTFTQHTDYTVSETDKGTKMCMGDNFNSVWLTGYTTDSASNTSLSEDDFAGAKVAMVMGAYSSIAIPEGVTQFAGSGINTSSIKLPTTIKYLDSNVLYSCSNLQYNVSNGINYLGNDYNPYVVACHPVESLSEFIFDSSTVTIAGVGAIYGAYDFDNNSAWLSQVKVNIPSNIKYITECAFIGMAFDSITFNEGLEYIGNEALCSVGYHISSFDGYDLSLPNTLRYVGKSAFNSCKFNEVYIPSNCKFNEQVFNYASVGTFVIDSPFVANNFGWCMGYNINSTSKIRDLVVYIKDTIPLRPNAMSVSSASATLEATDRSGYYKYTF